MRAAPAVSRAKGKRKTHTSIQVQRRHSGIPCAMALRLTSRSPRRIGLCCLRRLRIAGSSAPGRADLPSADLTPTTEASGPHDFTVRFSIVRPALRRPLTETRPANKLHARHRRVHRIPSQRSVTMANAPSSGQDGVSPKSDLPDGESENLPVGLFCRRCGAVRRMG